MARCEDFPCCGHEMNDCPSHRPTSRYLPYPCVDCGKKILKVKAVRGHESFCEKCYHALGRSDGYDDPRDCQDTGYW